MGEEHRQRPQRTRRGFTKEFKRDAVELVRATGRSPRSLESWAATTPRWELGPPGPHRPGEAEGLTTEERERLRELEAENTRLRMERDLRRRTVAFWVTETSTP